MARHQRYLRASRVQARIREREQRRTASAARSPDSGSNLAYADVDTMDVGETRRVARHFSLDVEVLDPNGPGGGNALVRVTGDPANVRRFLDYENYDLDAHQIVDMSRKTASAGPGPKGPFSRRRRRDSDETDREYELMMAFARAYAELGDDDKEILDHIMGSPLAEIIEAGYSSDDVYDLMHATESLQEYSNFLEDKLLGTAIALEDLEDEENEKYRVEQFNAMQGAEDAERTSYLSRRRK